MIIINFLIAGLLVYLAYRLIRILVATIKLGIDHANHLEKEFGSNVFGAAKFTLSGQSPRKEADHDK